MGHSCRREGHATDGAVSLSLIVADLGGGVSAHPRAPQAYLRGARAGRRSESSEFVKFLTINCKWT
jgi:hypothetical protein